MDWQPIETAPKDQSILVYGVWQSELGGSTDEPCIWMAWFSYDMWHVEGTDYYACYVINPTHWMPLPQPPKAGE